MTGLKAVCFDLDDTLYDYQQYARSGLVAAADWLEGETGQRFHKELLDLYFEDGVTEGTFDEFFARHDLPEATVSDLVERFHRARQPMAPYPNAEMVLDQLSRDHALGIITDGRGGRLKLDRLGLRQYFDVVLVTHPIDRAKPDPAVFRRMLAALSVPPSRAAYVGDDPRVDFQGPNDLGMRSVRMRRGRFTDLEPESQCEVPDEEIDDLAELLDILASSGAAAEAET